MDGYSEVFQTLGAMVIFSLILSTSNKMILMNTSQEVETEAEAAAITIAQNIIEEAQMKPFDANTANGEIPEKLPGEFTSCGPGSGEYRTNYNDFDDYDGYTDEIDTKFGPKTFKLNVEVSYVSPSNNYDIDKGSKDKPTYYKKMRVTVTSDYLDNHNQKKQFSHLRPYYKTQN